jgi:hypothetical protein
MVFSRPFAALVGSVAVHAHETVSRISPVEVPGRRLALGPAVLVEARGEDILRFLGDDQDERADFIDDLLKRCSQEELDQIMAALAQAMQQRAERGETVGEGVGRRRDRRGRRDEREVDVRDRRADRVNEVRDRRERRELEYWDRRDRRLAEVRDLREERRRRRRAA